MKTDEILALTRSEARPEWDANEPAIANLPARLTACRERASVRRNVGLPRLETGEAVGPAEPEAVFEDDLHPVARFHD